MRSIYKSATQQKRDEVALVLVLVNRLGVESCSANYFQIWLKVNTGTRASCMLIHTYMRSIYKSAPQQIRDEVALVLVLVARLGAESCSANYFQIWLKVNTGTRASCMLIHTYMRSIYKSATQQKSEPKFACFGAGGQTWTGTVVTPQDFKSCASADSATPAYWRHHSDSNWGMRVLQTRALPLGYGAIFKRQCYYITRI